MENMEQEIIERVLRKESLYWKNPLHVDPTHKDKILHGSTRTEEALKRVQDNYGIGIADILEAEKRLKRFMPFFRTAFPETEDGIIESPLKEAVTFSREVLGGERNPLSSILFYCFCFFRYCSFPGTGSSGI